MTKRKAAAMPPEVGSTSVVGIIELAKMYGGARVARGMSGMATAAEAAALKEIRDRKLYLGVPAKTLAQMAGLPVENFEGETETFEEFCRALGFSRQRVYEKIKFLEDLGGDFLQRADELGLPRKVLRLTGKIEGNGRRHLLKLARDPETDRERLVGTITSLVEESGALQKERDELAEDLAEKEAKIEKGKKQLRALQEKLHNTKNELDALKAGKAIPEEDEKALRELAEEAGGVMAFFDRLERIKWGERTDLAASFAGLVADRAMDFTDEMLAQHADGTPDTKQRKAFKRLSLVARTAADALTKGKLAKKRRK
jgi:uncharacterized coiled-coil protein SlyX